MAVNEFPFVTVLIPTYGRPEETAVAAQSVLEVDYPAASFEVIVIDSSPNDLTVNALAPLEKLFPHNFRVLRKAVAEGPGASRNAGALIARGELFACFDSDCVADTGWLKAAVAPFAHNPKLGIVQGKTLPNPAHPRGMMARFVQVDRANPTYECCNVVYRREAFEQVDGFSPDFNLVVPSGPQKPAQSIGSRLQRLWSFAHFNALLGFDTDLAWRVLERGWQSTFVAEALVYHAVTRLTPVQCLFEGAYYAYSNPPMIARHPGIRDHLYLRIFTSKASAYFCLFVGSTLAALLWNPIALLGCLPHIVSRCSGPSRFWKGIRRPFRFLAYLPRDLVSFLAYATASIRFRTILL